MPILFTCPHCGLQTNVADHFAGNSGPCARCGQTVTVPFPGVRTTRATAVFLRPTVTVLCAGILCYDSCRDVILCASGFWAACGCSAPP